MSKESRVKKPQQDRSRESLERVLEAGLDILVTEGWHQLTLARVCDRAGVSVGMLYRRFHGREDLLSALKNRWIDDAIAKAEELKARPFPWDKMEASKALRLAIHTLAESFRRDEAKTKLFGLHGVLDEEELKRLQAVSIAYSEWYRMILHHHIDAITHPNPQRAIDFSYNLLLDTMIRRMTHGGEFATGTMIGTWEEFQEEMFIVCAGYLFHSGLRNFQEAASEEVEQGQDDRKQPA